MVRVISRSLISPPYFIVHSHFKGEQTEAQRGLKTTGTSSNQLELKRTDASGFWFTNHPPKVNASPASNGSCVDIKFTIQKKTEELVPKWKNIQNLVLKAENELQRFLFQFAKQVTIL